jgi:hypothetical protein
MIMLTRRHAQWLFPAALLLLLDPGCVTLTRERPLPVQVIDAETRQPIRGAEIQLDYAVPPPAWASMGATGMTDDEGVARLWAAPCDMGFTVRAAHTAYLMDKHEVSAGEVKSMQPAGLFEAVDRRPAAVVIELFAEPRPTIELVLPAGFRGQVRAVVRPQAELPVTTGERLFSYLVAADGSVQAAGPPILNHVFATDFRLRFADDAPLSRNAKESEVGFWWLKSEGDAQVFFVGTVGEFDTVRRALGLDGGATERSGRGGRGGGGSGGGRRGGSRRGGGQPSGASGP